MAYSNLYQPQGVQCIKLVLLLFNFIFLLTGILMVVLGTTINAIYSDFAEVLAARFFSPSTILTAIGFIVFAIACFGVVGAIRESTCLITVFTLLLAIVFALEMTAGVASYLLMSQVGAHITTSLNQTFLHYYDSEPAKNVIDTLQSELQCCGLSSYKDWNDWAQDQELPQSCLVGAKVYSEGCLYRLRSLVEQSGILLGGTAITLALMQLIGVCFSYSLARKLRLQKSLREARRMLIREQLLTDMDQYYTIDPKSPIPFAFSKDQF